MYHREKCCQSPVASSRGEQAKTVCNRREFFEQEELHDELHGKNSQPVDPPISLGALPHVPFCSFPATCFSWLRQSPWNDILNPEMRQVNDPVVASSLAESAEKALENAYSTSPKKVRASTIPRVRESTKVLLTVSYFFFFPRLRRVLETGVQNNISWCRMCPPHECCASNNLEGCSSFFCSASQTRSYDDTQMPPIS